MVESRKQLKHCNCGGDALVFKEKKTPHKVFFTLPEIRRHSEEMKRPRSRWAECLSCGKKGKQSIKHEEAVENWNNQKGE
ncbi:hypothetical protein SAMN05216522_12117 [Rosenbergiella nectarea]|uniref:Uncharacterized protein n=1 Tax=Rosenbergiella nectarea TaxID=988801 RepID=A0A1H9N1M9_9GAMM|nr:hypothetical protein SAMN05216522_12117 [Rosenbergiella nectarea]